MVGTSLVWVCCILRNIWYLDAKNFSQLIHVLFLLIVIFTFIIKDVSKFFVFIKLVPSIFQIGSQLEIMKSIGAENSNLLGSKSLALIQRCNVYEETGISMSIFEGSSIRKNTVFGLLTRYFCYKGTKDVTGNC